MVEAVGLLLLFRSTEPSSGAKGGALAKNLRAKSSEIETRKEVAARRMEREEVSKLLRSYLSGYMEGCEGFRECQTWEGLRSQLVKPGGFGVESHPWQCDCKLR